MWRYCQCGVFLSMAWGLLDARLDAQTAPGQTENTTKYKFAVGLYHRLAANPGNLFFSPYSVSSCLSMAAVGARGATAAQMAQVLGLGQGQTTNAQSFQIGHENGPIELNVANGLWIQADYHLLPDYLGRITHDFSGGVRQADFVHKPERAAEAINSWVAENTKGRIRDIVSPSSFDEYTRMILANAIYFKGTWAVKFEPGATQAQPFTLIDGSTVQAQLMTHVDQLKYTGNEGFQAVEIPYSGGTVSMIVLLPHRYDGLEQLEGWLTPAFVASWLARLQPQPVELHLPRFKLDSSFQLNQHLQKMGCINAFSPKEADFSGIDGTTNLYISSVVHTAWAEVNEKGTEAAAVTALAVNVGGLHHEPPPRPPVFRADHPFLFFIRHVRSGQILFMGRLSKPVS